VLGVPLISAGYTHTCLLTAAAAAYCWGENSSGQLGDGTTTRRIQPVPVLVPPGVTFATLPRGVREHLRSELDRRRLLLGE